VIATEAELELLAESMGVSLPPAPLERERLLSLAQDMVEALACRIRFTTAELAALDAEQTQALADAICTQALWLYELDIEWIGPDDVAGIPEGVTFSRDPRPRLSPAVLETLALRGLIHRTGTVLPDPAAERPLQPWWYWL
jgi:hypothetical protein